MRCAQRAHDFCLVLRQYLGVDLVNSDRLRDMPGHAVAVVPLRPLLAQGGVLDQLRAKGFTVTTPGQEAD